MRRLLHSLVLSIALLVACGYAVAASAATGSQAEHVPITCIIYVDQSGSFFAHILATDTPTYDAFEQEPTFQGLGKAVFTKSGIMNVTCSGANPHSYPPMAIAGQCASFRGGEPISLFGSRMWGGRATLSSDASGFSLNCHGTFLGVQGQ
jgi:hypothetical protein